ncbi:hypothetical protein [Corynebacterium gerontici]|uniref:Uncharacterized protein n=1 Tax=Corynebacterium gerontici TaxID=2079234 RepID=A0A3G6J871_9CORY|nr:hypothetical protein [Corynebacterium gerontici]AZA12224.1 hypothetical protein CGERO_09685 [Corynebacterium gerontici]
MEKKPSLDASSKPESVLYATRCWWAVVCAELVHQLLNFVIGMQTRQDISAQIKASMSPNQQFSPELIDVAAVLALAGISAFSLLIVGCLAWFVRSFSQGSKRAELARKVLTYFGIYFVIRAVMLFFAQPVGAIPVQYYAVDGCIQMGVGVFACLGLIYASKKESAEHSQSTPSE